LDRYRYAFSFEDLGKMAGALQLCLDADGDCRALGDIEELREAAA
jgi:hypothetical protein